MGKKATKTNDDERKPKRRFRSPHPGVKIKRRKRGSRDHWLARWVDPLTGKVKELSLTKLECTTAETRRDWAIKKSQSLAATRAAVASGTATVTRTTIPTAIEQLEEAREEEVKASTLRVYREATKPFARWADKSGLICIEDLTPPRLTAFRDWFLSRSARVNATGKGIGRRKRVASERKRSAAQINKCIRTLRTVLNFWRKRGLTPVLTSDNIRDHLEYVKSPKPLPRFLRVADIKQLLKAAKDHDASTYNFARRGQARAATVHHYPPIFPFVAAALLTGMRFSELAELRWDAVDLDAHEIRLEHTATKTGHGRLVGLRESPALHALLKHLQLQRAGKEYVFGSVEEVDGKPVHLPMTRDIADAARKRLIADFEAPAFSWQDLRRTCGTFLTCSPAIYGAASAFLSAKRLGHSVAVAERYYVGAISHIAANCDTLEKAMGCANLLPKPEPTKAGRTRRSG